MAGRSWLDAVLGLGPEWEVTRVEPARKPKELRVELQRTGRSPLRCPHCGEACPGYDTRRREWRNLDAWGYKTFLVCNVPRVRCPEHGVVTIRVPWAEGSSRYTAQFEAEVNRVAEGSERQGGRRADAAELERGGWNHATCGGAGTCAPRDGSGPAPFGGRDLVPPQAPVRDRGVEPGDGPRPACRSGEGQGCADVVLRGLGGEVPGGRRERQHGHVGALHLGDPGDDPGRRDEDRVRPVPRGQAPRRRRGQGAAGGTPGAGAGGQRDPAGHQVAVAEGAEPEDACREAGVREAPCGHRTDRSGLGAEGGRREPLELSEQNLGAGWLAPVAGVGHRTAVWSRSSRPPG